MRVNGLSKEAEVDGAGRKAGIWMDGGGLAVFRIAIGVEPISECGSVSV